MECDGHNGRYLPHKSTPDERLCGTYSRFNLEQLPRSGSVQRVVLLRSPAASLRPEGQGAQRPVGSSKDGLFAVFAADNADAG